MNTWAKQWNTSYCCCRFAVPTWKKWTNFLKFDVLGQGDPFAFANYFLGWTIWIWFCCHISSVHSVWCHILMWRRNHVQKTPNHTKTIQTFSQYRRSRRSRRNKRNRKNNFFAKTEQTHAVKIYSDYFFNLQSKCWKNRRWCVEEIVSEYYFSVFMGILIFVLEWSWFQSRVLLGFDFEITGMRMRTENSVFFMKKWCHYSENLVQFLYQSQLFRLCKPFVNGSFLSKNQQIHVVNFRNIRLSPI